MNSVLPNRFHGSTTLSPKITTYDALAQRVRRALGEPLIQIEISSEQMYENIDYACEFFTKFAGTTEEFLIFRSDLYQRGVGLPIGRLMNISPEMYNSTTVTPSFSTTGYSGGAAPVDNGANINFYGTFTPASSSFPNSYGWDYDMNEYRPVVDVYSFTEGNNTGINTLFTIEHTIAQQAYFGQLLGNVGYDLVTWQALKGWLDTRDKVLALTPYMRFDAHNQILRIIPEPQTLPPYFGLIGCHMQLPIKDIVSQLWVYRYVLALTKISVAHVRSKYAGTNIFGGQTVNATDLFRQGEKEKDDLEQELKKEMVDTLPPKFFVG